MRSRIFTARSKVESSAFVYRNVVVMFVCPRMRPTSASGIPLWTNRVAHVCRRSWNRRSLISATRNAEAQDRFTVSVMPKTRVFGCRLGRLINSFRSRFVNAVLSR